jgi:heme-degrading monooxygenase HmoA
MKKTFREVAAAAALSLVIAVPAMITVRAQAAKTGAPDLVAGLKATPGVLGVELAQTLSGKNVIFAWFENKQAVLKWYYSDTHMAAMAQFGATERRPHGPMADVPDDGRPILAIASVTLTGPPPTSAADLKGVPQIAIELYAPLPGGLAVGGRFAPSTVKVPGMVEAPAHAAAAKSAE